MTNLKKKRIAIPFVEFDKNDFITKGKEYEVLDLNVTTPKGLLLENDQKMNKHYNQALFYILGC